MDKLTGLHVFTTVVEQRSFAAAADRLELSAPMVSKHIKALEQQLGARLLDRTTRRVSVTEAGQAYYQRSKTILEELAQADAAVAELSDKPRGILRLNVPMSFGLRHVVPHLTAFMAQYPALDVDLSLDDRYVDLVADGVDAAIRIGQLEDSSLVARKLGETQLMAVASPAYLAAHGTPQVPTDLQTHSCIHYKLSTLGRVWPFGGAQPQAVRIGGRLSLNNGDAARLAACAGQGIALLPDFIVADDLKNGALVQILADFSLPGLPIQVVYPHSRYLSPKVQVLTRFLKAKYALES